MKKLIKEAGFWALLEANVNWKIHASVFCAVFATSLFAAWYYGDGKLALPVIAGVLLGVGIGRIERRRLR